MSPKVELCKDYAIVHLSPAHAFRLHAPSSGMTYVATYVTSDS